MAHSAIHLTSRYKCKFVKYITVNVSPCFKVLKREPLFLKGHSGIPIWDEVRRTIPPSSFQKSHFQTMATTIQNEREEDAKELIWNPTAWISGFLDLEVYR